MRRDISDVILVSSGSDVVSCNVNGGEVLLSLRRNVYFGLDTVGSFVWRHIRGQATSVRDLVSRIVENFDVSESICRTDLMALLSEMKEAGLVEFADAPAT